MDNNYMKEFRTVRGYELNKHAEKELSSSMEDYLEMIYRLSMENDEVRVSMLSEKLQVKPSSVSKMCSRLRTLGLLEINLTSSIILTEKGKGIAEYLLYRHDVIEKFLMFLGSKEHLQETELLEHTISPETVESMDRLTQFFRKNKDIYSCFLDWKNKFQ